MKKAQILSALALAFALGLGVVAPVANIYASETEEAAAVASSTATATQIKNVISTVNNNASYKKMATLIGAVEAAYTDENGDVVEDTLQVKTVAAAKTALETAIKQFNNKYATGDKTLSTMINDAKAADTQYSKYVTLYDALETAEGVAAGTIKNVTVEKARNDLQNAIAAVNQYYNKNSDTEKELGDVITNVNENAPNFSKFETLIDAVKDGEATYKVEDGLRKALAAAGEIKTRIDGAEDIDDLIDLAQAFPTGTSYGQYKSLYDAVAAGQEAVDDKANTGSTKANYDLIVAIEDAYKAATETELGIVTPGANEGSNKKVTLTTENVTVTGDFEDGVVLTVEKVERKVEAFGDRKTAMYDIKLTKDGKTYNFDGSAIVTIKFEGVDGSKAGVYYVNNENKADFMKGAEIKGDVATFSTTHFSVYAIVEDAAAGLPNTGVIAAAVEGNASTTVAMVAGIATALTAAGAGVVAYRNARRSVRK